MLENSEEFVNRLSQSLTSSTFVKLTLGNYKGGDTQLQKIFVRLVTTKKGTRLFFLYRGATRDTAKNYDIDTGIALIAEALDGQFFSGHLFTTENDLQLEIGKKGKSRLNIAKSTFKSAPPQEHDRSKKMQVDQSAFYLKALGITDETGRVRDKQQDKWRQINKFVEILANLVDKSELKDKKKLAIVDMGSGKGYLTFAAYDYFSNIGGIDVTVTGVDTKQALVDLDNSIAAASGFTGLSFTLGHISETEVADIDILIALHACDTATDDAIFKGIASGANLIVVAPCCHQEVRPQIKPPAMLKDTLKHGVMMERTAETITDALRSLLLERSGYATRLFEFVPMEHTPKNNMLVGTRLTKPVSTDDISRQIEDIKSAFGISEQRLEKLLNKQEPR
jgi:SAM-dependent methyltransferase